MPRKKTAPTRVARFRVTLAEIAPPVWRTFEIDAAGTFWDLHVAIQDVFGWPDRINVPALIDDSNWTWRLPWPVDELDAQPEAAERQRILRCWSERHARG